MAEFMTEFKIHDRDAAGGWIEIGGKSQRFYVHRKRDVVEVWIGGRTYRVMQTHKRQESDGSGEIRALMPGRIRRIEVKAGERVTARQPLVVMESMKMETTLTAPGDGVVAEVKCGVGQTVEMGELLVVMDVR
jgi:acetyl-CoA/propionyl-CoA carboxylase biotin carboxyl carrier protein